MNGFTKRRLSVLALPRVTAFAYRQEVSVTQAIRQLFPAADHGLGLVSDDMAELLPRNAVQIKPLQSLIQRPELTHGLFPHVSRR